MDTNNSKPKKKQVNRVNPNVLESLKDLGGGVGKAAAKDFLGGVSADVLQSLLGKSKTNQELKPNQYLEFNKEKTPARQFVRPEIKHKPYIRREEAGLKQKIEEVRQELAKLVVSIKSLNQEVEKTVKEVPVDPGVYHLNYFERLKSVLILMRKQVEDSRTWLFMQTTRKKKMNYWKMFKKHGTKFGLSSERTVATQAG